MGLVLLECTLDDVTGEVLAHAIEALVASGAADAHALSGIGKKGRPVYVLRVVCENGKAHSFAELMARETGTMGVKKFPFAHFDFEKKMGKIRGVITKSTQFSSKFEYESLNAKARETGMSLRNFAKKLSKK